uniref:hypothetical protein n=1 Tax=Cupriavidus yeoncheonensis TaxID=1462994 RepID=UPI003F49133F
MKVKPKFYAVCAGIPVAVTWFGSLFTDKPVTWAVYVLALVLLGAGASIGDTFERLAGELPVRPCLVRAGTIGAAVAAFVLFVWGFYAFSWWLPLTALAGVAFGTAPIILSALRSGHAEALAFSSSLGGFVSAGWILVL